MSEILRFCTTAVLLLAGLGTIAWSIFGVFRFRFVLNRMHCAAIIDTLGAMLLLLGLIVSAPEPAYFWKLVLIIVFLWIGSPIASHLVARMELLTDGDALEHMELPEEEDADGLL